MKPILSLLAIVLLGIILPVEVLAQESDDPLMSAISEMQAGNTDKAIAALTEVIRLQPNNGDAYFLRSTLRVTSEDTAGALADLNKAIELKPNVGAYYYNRAIVRLVSKDTGGAMKDLDSAVVNNYKIEPVLSLRSQLRMEQGDLVGALADLDEALKLNPNNPRSYYTRSNLLLELGHTDRALADLNYLLTWYETDPTKRPKQKAAINDDRSVKEQTNRPGPDWNSKGQVTSESFTLSVATETVNESPADKEMVPIIGGAYFNRGLIYSSRDSPESAISEFTKSIRLRPDNSSGYFYRALEFEVKGDLVGALSDVNRSIELEPRNGNYRVEHGVILLFQGKNKEAQVDFDMLLKSDPVLWQKRIDERIAAVRKLLPSRKI